MNSINPLLRKVAEFNKAFGIENQMLPTIPDAATLELRYKLALEELDEFKEAAEAGDMPGMLDALLFRNWIYSGIQRRWSGEFLNIENGVVEHGYYNKFFSQLYKELRQGKADILFGRNLTDDQKAARIKALAEITTALAIFIMIS